MSEPEVTKNVIKKTATVILPAGFVIDNRFETIRLLPDNDRPTYLCRRLSPPRQGEQCVVKLLTQGNLGEDQSTTEIRFQHEVVAAMSVKHHNVVRMDEMVKGDGLYGYVVEYVLGETLESILTEGLPSLEHTVLYLRQICAGTEAIHKAGIVHRNIKPRNIVINNTGHLKIVDFALVKLQDQKNLTTSGTILGTLDYVSPEYVAEGVVDWRLDIYAIGVIAYEMITGGIPFYADDLIAMFHNRMMFEPERPDIINPNCPTEFADLIMRALERDRTKRYQSAGEMLSDLNALPGLGQTPLPKPPKSGSFPVVPAPQAAAAVAVTPEPEKTKSSLLDWLPPSWRSDAE